ncbi:MAG: ABC transporter ATP-binding protein [Acidimicrobiales bacterium]
MPLLDVRSVAKSFGGLRALDGCSLTVEEGEIAGLIGPNGSGKTTLFNVITGYVRPDSGVITLRDRPITGARPAKVFDLGLGRTFQITRIFARLTVFENMLVATQRHEGWLRSVVKGASSPSERRRAMEMLDFVGLAANAALPAGNLSFGQRKLLELAYVLIADPVVVLLDEPAGGINPTLINEIGERIRTLNRSGRTFLVVEHNMEFVMGLCDRVTVMHQGRDILTGSPDEVRRDPRVLDAYLGGSDDDEDWDEPVGAEAGPGGSEVGGGVAGT